MILYNNGIIIQEKNVAKKTWIKNEDTETQNNYENYKGIEKFMSWPLEAKNDSFSIELTAEANKRWFGFIESKKPESYSIKVVPDLKYCNKYIQHCTQIGVSVKVLFCRTSRHMPIWNAIVPELWPLGYDYATSQSYYSAILHELCVKPYNKYEDIAEYKSFIECRQLLNTNMLFNSESDILSFVKKRNEVIASPIEWEKRQNSFLIHLLEPYGDFCIFHLSEVKTLF